MSEETPSMVLQIHLIEAHFAGETVKQQAMLQWRTAREGFAIPNTKPTATTGAAHHGT